MQSGLVTATITGNVALGLPSGATQVNYCGRNCSVAAAIRTPGAGKTFYIYGVEIQVKEVSKYATISIDGTDVIACGLGATGLAIYSSFIFTGGGMPVAVATTGKAVAVGGDFGAGNANVILWGYEL